MSDFNPVVRELHVYPLKSAGGIAVDRAAVDMRGLEFDRRWMLVDAEGMFISQREYARMALLNMRPADGGFVIEAPSMPPLFIAHDLPMSDRRMVQVWSSRLRAWTYPAAVDEWFTQFLGVECHLTAMPDDGKRIANPRNTRSITPIRFVDGYPILLLSDASLADLNSRLATPLPHDRFRANMIISGCEAFAEDGWDRFSIGDVEFETIKPCPRCVVTTIDQRNAQKSDEPLRTLASYRNRGGAVEFGMYARALNAGTINCGAEILLTLRRSEADSQDQDSRPTT